MGLFKKKEKQEGRACVAMAEAAEEFANVYYVKLLFQTAVNVDAQRIQEALRRQFKNIDVVMETELMKVYALLDHKVNYRDAAIPSQLSVLDMIPFQQDTIPDLSKAQCWGMEEPEQLMASCQYEVVVHDFMAGGHERQKRCQIFADFLDVMLSIFPECIAMYWPHSQKFIAREQYEVSTWNSKELHFLDGGLLTRFFNIQDSDAMVVDTIGLTALDLPDIQCHFHNLDPNDVVRFVGNIASYLFQEGDIINDGETIDGFAPPHARWICQHEDALIQPRRVVLDIEMNEYAAGNRGKS